MYDRSSYWDRVAAEIASRNTGSDIAGFDTPADRYKREKVAKAISAIDVRGKSVLEVGCGTGLNLPLFAGARVTAVDVSANMIEIARKRLPTVSFHHISGDKLPLPDLSVDCAFTVTVLQHNLEPSAIIGEICRVTAETAYIFEDTSPIEKHRDTYVVRRPSAYITEFAKRGFRLVEKKHIRTFATSKVFSLFDRLTGLRGKHEGAGTRRFEWLLPVTSTLDLLPIPVGNTLMVFERHGRCSATKM